MTDHNKDFDASNPEDIKKRNRLIKNKDKTMSNDIKTVLGTVSGRRLIWSILKQCRIHETVFSSDTSMMSYRAGKRDVGLYLLSEIMEADSNLYIKLLKEQGEN